MKRIIDGKKYDTETATLVAEWNDSKGWSDFHHVEEYLYRKRTGEYFLYGEGGPASRWAEPYPTGGWQSGNGIKPLSDAEARAWAEACMDADEYEAEFGEVPE